MSSLFSKPTVTPQLVGFSGGGYKATPIGNSYNITDSPTVQANVSGLQGAGQTAGDTFGQMADTVGPGFNDLLQSRLGDLNDQARSALGNLQQNLSARRVMGSSFGNDTVSRLGAEFSKQRDAVIADNFVKSAALREQLTMDQLKARTTQFQTGIDAAQFDAKLGAQLSGQGQTAINQAAQLNAQLESNYQAGIGKLIGTGAGLLAAPLTSGLSAAFSGASSAVPTSYGSYGGIGYPIFGSA